MHSLPQRFIQNPILQPKDVPSSEKDLEVACLLNPGVFIFDNKIWLLVRVAERPFQQDNSISFPVLEDGKTIIKSIPKNQLDQSVTDARVVRFEGQDFLTTLSHLRLFCSDNGIHFTESIDYPLLKGEGKFESYGIEDCRVTIIDEVYYLTYTAVSKYGVAVGLRTTTNWKLFAHHGLIFPPHNKDVVLFDEKINGLYYALHRPSSVALGGNYIWLASSLDTLHWGNHICLLTTRPNHWDSERIGAGAAPIKTPQGWLHIYHGANDQQQYSLGALLFDLQNPAIVIARSEQPIMQPQEPYELNGFFADVLFTNGHIVNGDELIVYYGAADAVVCGATFSIKAILASLNL
jgi:beta-1,2-mannobiose phosphorylase / 1,2-beta-oligomannan phosphorylase